MDVEEIKMTKKDATKLWREYVKGCKDNPTDRHFQEMKKVYNQLKCGRKLIDINKVFEMAGLNENYEPKIAICQANSDKVFCKYFKSGGAFMTTRPFTDWRNNLKPHAIKTDIKIKLSKLPEGHLGQYDQFKILETSIPPIPPSLKPKGNMDNYYIMWEVDEWNMLPPVDPYLLRRVTENIFVVVGAWDLTELERSVIKGRAY